MPDEAFLEEYPLYRKFVVESMPKTFVSLEVVRIKVMCPECGSEQTFTMDNTYGEAGWQSSVRGALFRLVYQCAHCEKSQRMFYVRADPDGKWYMKVGQYPAWETKSDPRVENLLGEEHASLYRKALVCESQSYGIAAFAYYRRIVEEVIDGLLDEVADLMVGSELQKYKAALEMTKQTTVTQDKIELVKDLLPPILRPDGVNPLGVLHSSLSAGLHSASDEECLEEAAIIREALVFLVGQVAASREASKTFTAGMRKLLTKKSQRG